jgi:hypothetical protein
VRAGAHTRLTIEVIYWSRLVATPKAFLSSVYHNGSICSLKICCPSGGAKPSKRVRRYIRACTARNRSLPRALSTLFQTDESVPTGTKDIPSPRSNRFPTLCQSAMQAPQMAPNNVLIGLLASLEATGSAQRGGKRIASQNPIRSVSHTRMNEIELSR